MNFREFLYIIPEVEEYDTLTRHIRFLYVFPAALLASIPFPNLILFKTLDR